MLALRVAHGAVDHERDAADEESRHHPDDAADRRITDGSPVAAHNDRGRVDGIAAVTDSVQPGVVVVPFGRWLDGGQGANSLTNDALGDLGGGPTFCDVLVEVSRS